MREALRAAEEIVGQHPALETVASPRKSGHEFKVRILKQDVLTSRLRVVAGLVSRAREVGKDGFEVASWELKFLLDLSFEDGGGSVPHELTTGYHVSLFFGLQFSDEVEIADGWVMVPLESTASFLNREEMLSVAPGIGEEYGWKGVGAILKPVPWKPIVLPLGEESEPELDWGGSFFEDARIFIELLSLSHAVPIVTLMDIDYCTHRTVSYLLGEPYYHSGNRCKSWLRPFGGLRELHKLEIDALDEAKQVFGELDRARYEELAPVISRLSEALARTGQFAADDKILDVAIVLEQMYELDQGEISFKLKTRAASFLKTDTAARLEVFRDVGMLYGVRSRIVHRGKKKPSVKAKRDAFEKGFDVARGSVIKLLREGLPKDWNEVVLAAGNAE